MKKIIALLLALVMTFSVATIAFAAEEDIADAPVVEEEAIPDNIADGLKGLLGEYAWILDLPFETVGPALWFAKMAVKFVISYISICNKLGLDPTETAQKIFDFAAGLVEQYKPAEDTAAPEATPDAV